MIGHFHRGPKILSPERIKIQTGFIQDSSGCCLISFLQLLPREKDSIRGVSRQCFNHTFLVLKKFLGENGPGVWQKKKNKKTADSTSQATVIILDMSVAERVNRTVVSGLVSCLGEAHTVQEKIRQH